MKKKVLVTAVGLFVGTHTLYGKDDVLNNQSLANTTEKKKREREGEQKKKPTLKKRENTEKTG